MILYEQHNHNNEYRDCNCSYCKKLQKRNRFSFGIWIPRNKKWNSWFVIWFVGKKYNKYLRFNIPFLKK